MDRLIDIVARHDTDKESIHRYVSGFYEEAFAALRTTARTVVEIGVYRGGSIAMWSEFFPNAAIVVIDIDPAGFAPVDRAAYLHGDAYGGEMRVASADVVIDDGPHTRESQIEAVRRYLPALSLGGIMVVEDIQPEGRERTLADLAAAIATTARDRTFETGVAETEPDAGDSVLWWARRLA